MKFIIAIIFALVLGSAYMMSPWHYGNDGYLGTDPHFGFATEHYRVHGKEYMRLCLGSLENCRVMWKPGMKGHMPLVTACGANGVYYFCKPRGAHAPA